MVSFFKLCWARAIFITNEQFRKYFLINAANKTNWVLMKIPMKICKTIFTSIFAMFISKDIPSLFRQENSWNEKSESKGRYYSLFHFRKAQIWRSSSNLTQLGGKKKLQLIRWSWDRAGPKTTLSLFHKQQVYKQRKSGLVKIWKLISNRTSLLWKLKQQVLKSFWILQFTKQRLNYISNH